MLLMEEAERIAKEEHGSQKIGVISGLYKSNFCKNDILIKYKIALKIIIKRNLLLKRKRISLPS